MVKLQRSLFQGIYDRRSWCIFAYSCCSWRLHTRGMRSVGFRPPAPRKALLETDPVVFFYDLCCFGCCCPPLLELYRFLRGNWKVYHALKSPTTYFVPVLLSHAWTERCFFSDGAGTFSNGRLHCDLQVLQTPTLASCPLWGWRYPPLPYLTTWMKMPVYCIHIYIYVYIYFETPFTCLSSVFFMRFHHTSVASTTSVASFTSCCTPWMVGLFSKRKGCWHQGQHEMSKIFKSYLSFHIIPSRCISSSVVSCYFHHVSSSFWCHLTPLRTPLRTPFYVSSCVVSVRHCAFCFHVSALISTTTNFERTRLFSTHFLFTWFVGCLNVAVPLPGADGLPVRAVFPSPLKNH